MARRNQTIGELAMDVLNTVERQELVKSAAVSYTKEAAVSTELGKLMVKVAEKVRAEAQGPEISYGDLNQFRKTYGL